MTKPLGSTVVVVQRPEHFVAFFEGADIRLTGFGATEDAALGSLWRQHGIRVKSLDGRVSSAVPLDPA